MGSGSAALITQRVFRGNYDSLAEALNFAPLKVDAVRIATVRQTIMDFEKKYPGRYLAARRGITAVCDKYSYYPNDDESSEWIITRDDDDIILPVPAFCFWQPEDVVMLGFSSIFVSLIELNKWTRTPDYKIGCAFSGRIFRRSFLNSLAEEQRKLVLLDHLNSHRYVHFTEKKYVLYPNIISCYRIFHPFCISNIYKNGFSFPEKESLIAFIRENQNAMVWLEEYCAQLFDFESRNGG